MDPVVEGGVGAAACREHEDGFEDAHENGAIRVSVVANDKKWFCIKLQTHRYPRLRMPITYNLSRSFILRLQIMGTGSAPNTTSVKILQAASCSCQQCPMWLRAWLVP